MRTTYNPKDVVGTQTNGALLQQLDGLEAAVNPQLHQLPQLCLCRPYRQTILDSDLSPLLSVLLFLLCFLSLS